MKAFKIKKNLYLADWVRCWVAWIIIKVRVYVLARLIKRRQILIILWMENKTIKDSL